MDNHTERRISLDERAGQAGSSRNVLPRAALQGDERVPTGMVVASFSVTLWPV